MAIFKILLNLVKYLGRPMLILADTSVYNVRYDCLLNKILENGGIVVNTKLTKYKFI